MISSVIWLFMVHINVINPDHAPWNIYLPIVAIECVVYLKSLPKLLDILEGK
jgi:hypothetical protein